MTDKHLKMYTADLKMYSHLAHFKNIGEIGL